MKHSALCSTLLRLIGARPFYGWSDRRLASGCILTIDAFDTLITRIVFYPTDGFAICGRLLLEQSITAMDPIAWRDVRHNAECAIANSKMPGQVLLEEIYDSLVQRGAVAAHLKHAALNVELAVEQMLSRPIAANVEATNALGQEGGTIAVISDTYLPHEALFELLQNAGLKVDRRMVYASSQSGRTKRSGMLFPDVLQRLGIRARTAVHVGDNFLSDVYRARVAGLSIAPYIAGAANRYESRLYAALLTPDMLGSVIAGSARAVRLGRRFPNAHEQTIWDVSADVTGPLLFSFVAWTLREAARHGLRTLYFLSRDGEILLKIAQELRAVLQTSVEYRYLYVSRQSLHLPAVTALNEDERFWILDNAPRRNLAEMLQRLDIGYEEFVSTLPPHSPLRKLAPKALLTPSDVEGFRHCLDLPGFQELVLRKARQQRILCLSYLEGEALLSPGRIGVVDLGWRGRLQRSLCKIIATIQPDFPSRLYGFYMDLKDPPAEAGALAVFSGLCRPDQRFSWASRGPLFEIFCAAHHGAVRRYAETTRSIITPVLASDRNPEAQAWGLAVQQEAVVTFAREATRGMRLAGIDPLQHIEPLAQAAADVVRMFIERPSRTEADTFGSFAHSEDDQHRKFEPVAERIDFRPPALLKRLGPAYRARRISFWPEASVVRSVPSWLRVPALAALYAMPGRRK